MHEIAYEQLDTQSLPREALIYRDVSTTLFPVMVEVRRHPGDHRNRMQMTGEPLTVRVVARVSGQMFCVKWHPEALDAPDVWEQGYTVRDERVARRLFPELWQHRFAVA